jgi:23S rRNA (cytidine1920-2'-O)/16S rRNA (cytidine1409-2'-O)-methyltransferase
MPPTPRQRLDDALVEQGYALHLAEARTLIMTRHVRINEQIVEKPGHPFKQGKDTLQVRRKGHPYVSRGGVKLQHALQTFQLECTGCIALDVGASTGGFTDCLLQHGAKQIFAVDVGEGLLHSRLVQDARVISMPHINGKNLTPNHFPNDAPPTVGVTDVSFISLKRILPPLCNSLFIDETTWVIALIKPQFEAMDYLPASEKALFNGVVQHEAQRQHIVEGVLHDLHQLMPNWHCTETSPSPIQGASGNHELVSLWKPIRP